MFRRVLPFLIPALVMAQAPVIGFDKSHHDFGKITPDRKVSARFKVMNTGNAVLNISQVNPSCGCTSTVVGKWSVNPGESTEVEATFNPQGMKGVVRKSMQVVSNDPKTPSATLTMEAEVVPEIVASKDAVYFSSIARSASPATQVRYSSGNGEAVQITEAKAPGAPYLRLNLKQDAKDAVLDIALEGPKIPKGTFRGVEVVTLRTSNPRVPVLNLNVVWDLKPSLSMTPPSVAWDNATAGQEQRTQVSIKQAENKVFRITGTKITNPLMRVDGLSQKAAAQHDLTIVLGKDAKAGRYSETVTLMTDDPEQPELTVRVYALVK
jgi:Protein of unknown function (DUF1573)